MQHCPKCFDEYVDEIQKCEKCNISLVEGEPSADQKEIYMVHNNPSGYKTKTNLILFVSIIVALLFLGSISGGLDATFSIIGIAEFIFFGGLLLYVIRIYKRRNKIYSNYKQMKGR